MGLICYCCFSLTKLEIVISPSITQKEERRIIHQRIALPLPFLIPILFFFLCASLQRLHKPKHKEDFWKDLHMLSFLHMFALCAFRCFLVNLALFEEGDSERVY